MPMTSLGLIINFPVLCKVPDTMERKNAHFVSKKQTGTIRQAWHKIIPRNGYLFFNHFP
jgi:hypothetical protein